MDMINQLLANPAVAAAVGTLVALAFAGAVKFLHQVVAKTENKLDDKIYDAVVAAFKDSAQ